MSHPNVKYIFGHNTRLVALTLPTDILVFPETPSLSSGHFKTNISTRIGTSNFLRSLNFLYTLLWAYVRKQTALVVVKDDLPICDSATRVFFLSQRGLKGRPSSRSLSPCRKNSSRSCDVHWKCRSHFLAGCEMSQQCRTIDNAFALSILANTDGTFV